MRLFTLVALVTLATSQQPPSAPPQTFRSGAQLVEVDVRVLKDGKFVTDLAPADFEIAEDGVRQTITSVVLIDGTAPPAPFAPSAPAPSAPSAPSAPPAPSSFPSIWLFVFDTNHLSPGGLNRTRDAVATFIKEKFRAGDLGGVVADGKMANNRLTSVRGDLERAVGTVKMPGDMRAHLLDLREWPRLQDDYEAWLIANGDRAALKIATGRACAEDPEACRKVSLDVLVLSKSRRLAADARRGTAQTLSVVDGLTNGLAKIPGPKTVVFFSEGFFIQSQESQLRQSVGLAARAGARFYAIDARGLNRGSASSDIIDQPVAFDSAGAQPKFDVLADGTNSLAVDTGGFAIRNENNFGRALDEIQRDAGTYYVVGYTPANAAYDGKYRAIEVRVSRPGVKVRARRGYLALEPAAVLLRRSAAVPAARETDDTSPKAGSPPPNQPLASTTVTPPATAPLLGSGRSAGAAEIMAALGKEDAATRMSPGSGNSAIADRGWAAYAKGDLEAAVEDLAEAARAADARPWVSYALGLARFALQQAGAAAQAWERVRREVPEFEPVYFNLADAYTLRKEDGAALKVLREAERRWPADSEVANAIGVIHVRRGALDAAIESFERATTVAVSDALGLFNLARAHQMRLLKSQRYDPQMQKWIGGDEDRRRAVENFRKYLQIGGPYERQAKEALVALAWK